MNKKNINLKEYFEKTNRTVRSDVRDGKETKTIIIDQVYETNIDDIWDAITIKERLSRWFLRVVGDLIKGGQYKLEGNANGTITECKKPSYFSKTWEFGGDITWVNVSLIESSEGFSKLKLEHVSLLSQTWKTYGPGALGVGWELGLLGLLLFLKFPEQPKLHKDDFFSSTDEKTLINLSSDYWGDAALKGGESKNFVQKAVKATKVFYTGTEVRP